MMELIIDGITFAAAHYLPGHPKCGGIHGHTYCVKNLRIPIEVLDEIGMGPDFGLVKGYFKEHWHHKFIIPRKDEGYWDHIYEETGHCVVDDNRVVLRFTTCEFMAEVIRVDLAELLDVNRRDIHFTLYEGPPNEDPDTGGVTV